MWRSNNKGAQQSPHGWLLIISASPLHTSFPRNTKSVGWLQVVLTGSFWKQQLDDVRPGRSFKFKANHVKFPLRQPVFECVMTKPLPVQSFSCSTTSTSSVDLKWCPPERHKRLKAFNIVIQSRDAKVGQLVNHDFDLVATRSNGK